MVIACAALVAGPRVRHNAPMRPLVVVALMLSGCFFITAPETGAPMPGKAYCTRNTASGACNCSTADPGLSSDTEYVDDCNSPPSGSQCCHDINGDGESTFCRCAQAQCAKDTDTNNCSCEYFDSYVVGRSRDTETRIDTCTSVTCCGSSSSCRCYNDTNISCAGGGEKVSSCSVASLPNPRACGGGQKVASSCRGLTWKR